MSGGRPAVTVRPAALSDLDVLVALEGAAFPASDRVSRRALRRAITSPTITVLVAAGDQGSISGYAMLERRRGSSVARLTSIAVAPGRCGTGIGGALLAAMQAEARALGAARLRLEVRADNAAARRLYERDGFHRFATVEDYYESGVAAWRYEKELGPSKPAGSEKRSTSRRSSTKARAP